MKTYQYSILRYRRSKSAGELVNIGLIMVVPDDERVFHFITPRYRRLSKFFGDFEGKGYKKMVDELRRQFDEILRPEEGNPHEARQIHLGEYVVTRDFNDPKLDDLKPKLVPGMESCFQWSQVNSGVHPRPEKRFQELREEFIVQHEPGGDKRERRDESKIQSLVAQHLRHSKFKDKLDFQKRLKGKHDVEHEFLVGWQNGTTQVLDALSFDYLDQGSIENKANRWCGTLLNLYSDGQHFQFTGVVAPPPRKELFKAYENACMLILDMEQTRGLIEENQLDMLDEELAADLS